MHHDGHFGALGCRHDRGRDEFEFAVRQKHFRRSDDDGRAHLFRRVDHRLQHVGIGGVEQPDRIVAFLRRRQNFL